MIMVDLQLLNGGESEKSAVKQLRDFIASQSQHRQRDESVERQTFDLVQSIAAQFTILEKSIGLIKNKQTKDNWNHQDIDFSNQINDNSCSLKWIVSETILVSSKLV